VAGGYAAAPVRGGVSGARELSASSLEFESIGARGCVSGPARRGNRRRRVWMRAAEGPIQEDCGASRKDRRAASALLVLSHRALLLEKTVEVFPSVISGKVQK
jgi:hypothetical protein